MTDPKPTLGPAGILANIAHYESLVSKSKDAWEQHLQELQYWIDRLNALEETAE